MVNYQKYLFFKNHFYSFVEKGSSLLFIRTSLNLSKNSLYVYINLFIRELEGEFFTLKMSQEKEKENPQTQVLEKKLISFVHQTKYRKYVSDKFIEYLKKDDPWAKFLQELEIKNMSNMSLV